VAFESFKLLAVILVSIASLAALLAADWRVTISFMAIQFTGAFLLIGLEWPFPLAVTILIAGWLSGAILGMAVISIPRISPPAESRTSLNQRSNPLFNFLAAVLIYLMVVSLAPQVQKWLPFMSIEQSLAALTLIGLGLLRLALDATPLSTTAALLSVLSGFEVIYATLTTAQFAIGALAVITLFIALSGAYLLLAPSMEETN
jgi:hypothetical protein